MALKMARGGVAVIVPCFNAALTLGATLDSAIRQGDVARQITVVDDGSTDDTLSVARAFEPRVRVLNGPNRGVSAARNRGVAETAGEWILFLDADDVLLPGTLNRRLDTAATSGADVVICDWQEFIDDGKSITAGPVRSVDMESLVADPELACSTNTWATTAALIYHRSLVGRIGGFRYDLPIIQDARFLFDAAYHGARFAHSPHVGARYRVQAKSLSRCDPVRFWRDILLNGKQIEQLWRGRGPLSLAQREALRGIFDNAGRGLFAAGDPACLKAFEFQRGLGLPLPRHPRIAGLLARAVGLGPARQVLRLLGR
jgi:glycosyltransferase involved in cell wall biosynthesis